MLSGSSDKSAIVWDVSRGQVQQRFRFHEAPTLVSKEIRVTQNILWTASEVGIDGQCHVSDFLCYYYSTDSTVLKEQNSWRERMLYTWRYESKCIAHFDWSMAVRCSCGLCSPYGGVRPWKGNAVFELLAPKLFSHQLNQFALQFALQYIFVLNLPRLLNLSFVMYEMFVTLICSFGRCFAQVFLRDAQLAWSIPFVFTVAFATMLGLRLLAAFALYSGRVPLGYD